MWFASSGTHASVAYVEEIVRGVVRSCSCPAGEYRDACCKHAARYYRDCGLLDPAPQPSAPALAVCGYCTGRGWETVVGKGGAAYHFVCQVCDGAGLVAVGDGENEPASPSPKPGSAAPATAVCGRCQGAGSLTVGVAGGCAVYPMSTTCHACHAPRRSGGTAARSRE